MGDVHQLPDKHGKQGAISANLVRRDVIEAAALYLSDEDTALAFAYSGWAQCALPHKRLAPDQPWQVTSDRVKLVVEPGRRPAEDSSDALEWVGVPFGAHARLNPSLPADTGSPHRQPRGRVGSILAGLDGAHWHSIGRQIWQVR